MADISLAEGLQKAIAEDAAGKVRDQDAADKHAARATYFETVSSLGHKAMRGAKSALAALTPDVSGAGEAMLQQAGTVQQGMDVAGRALQKTGGFAEETLRSGPGAEYARSMEGGVNPEMMKDAPFLLRHGQRLTEDIWGGAEQALWGVTAGPLGRELMPVMRFLPKAIAPVVREALVNGSLSGGATALQQRIKGEQVHNIAEPIALGALIGAIGGMLAPEDAAAIVKNADVVKPVTSGFQSAITDMQSAARSMAATERGNPKEFMTKLARFAAGQGDETMAAKVRILAGEQPDLFKTPLMRKILAQANGGKAAVNLPRAGDFAKLFSEAPTRETVMAEGGGGGGEVGPLGIARTPKLRQTGEMVAHEGGAGEGEIGPLGIPLKRPAPQATKPTKPAVNTASNASSIISDNVRAHLDKLMTYDPFAGGEPSSDIVASRKAISKMAVDGTLKPEMIERGDHAERIAASIFRTARELEKNPVKGESFGQHFETAKEWKRRARALNAAPEMEPGPVDASSASSMEELRNHLDGDEQHPITATGPSKKRMTKEYQAKRDEVTATKKKGKFC